MLTHIYVHIPDIKRAFFFLQEAVEIPLENTYVNRFSGIKRHKVQHTRSFFYVPLLETLHQLLQHREISKEIHRVRSTDHNLLKDYMDGSICKNHPLVSSDSQALQIIAYYDELEVTNPIGSYVKTHKLGCLFFSLGNIRPQFRSSLKAIFLLAVARSEDIDRYGIDTFLKPFVEDLKSLYADGITVNATLYRGALVSFLADTQAAHKVGGFKGSVSFAHRICRSCMSTRDASQLYFKEDCFELRTPEDHENQCRTLIGTSFHDNSVKYGINRKAILEDVPSFSVVNGLPHDIMHDLFEGVVHYELKLFLNYCVSQNFFTVQILNSRIRGFDFAYEDKPSVIDPNSVGNDHLNKKFSQSAAQTITLIKNLPFLIADKIPQDDKNWHSMLLLIKICQIALSPVHSCDTVPYLNILVEEKLECLKQLYPSSSIKPKMMHYMIHYGSQVEQYGPLIHSWTMRHEAKLSFVKRSSRRGNFKNILKTIVKHHQQWLCYQLKCEQTLLYPETKLSGIKSANNLEDENDTVREQLRCISPTLSPTGTIVHHRWVKIHSFNFKLGNFVLMERDDMKPKFGKIEDILHIGETSKNVFFVQVYEAVTFCTHYNAFQLNATTEKVVISIYNLEDHHPYIVRKSFNVLDRNMYVGMHYTY